MKRALSGVTLLELVVVVLIIAILTTVATPVLVGQVTRARIAVAADTIRQLEIAVARYEIDTGEFPPSGSIASASTFGTNWGNSLLMEALLHSSGGNMNSPSSPRWAGPYLEFNEEQLRVPGVNGVPAVPAADQNAASQLLDPWESPYNYYRYLDYETVFATELPTGHPFLATETWFNPRTVQLWSAGPNGTTIGTGIERGREYDDINNY